MMKKIYFRPFCSIFLIEVEDEFAVSPTLPAINDPQTDVDGESRSVSNWGAWEIE